MIVAAVVTAIAALVLAVTLTAYAWHDYNTHPDRYGYRPGQRHRRMTGTRRGITRQPVGRWPKPWIRR